MIRPFSHQQALEEIQRAREPVTPWSGECQLPWHDPAFSRRMLAVHLDETTHMASRSPKVIRSHLDWLESQMPAGDGRGPAHTVLDIGCGPGLYCHELARRGLTTIGFDFAPASLDWARDLATREELDCTFLHQDLACLPDDFHDRIGLCDAATFWFCEFHSFPPETAGRFLAELAACLRPGGLFVLEYQPWDIFVKEDSSTWSIENASAFCAVPHLWLQEFTWDEEARTEIHVHWIIELESGNLQRYIQCHQAWTDADLVALLASVGLVEASFHPPVVGVDEQLEFPLLVTRKT